MSSTQKSLTRGARATFLRDGHELHSACDIPAAGAFVVRHLPPGQYVVRDSCGGEQNLNVGFGEEMTTILNGDVPGPTGAPGLSGVQTDGTRNVGRGGGAFTEPGQVAAGETITGVRRMSVGETPVELAAPLQRAATPRQRPVDPTAEERVQGAAGSPLTQESPIRSVAEMLEDAAIRANLGEDDRELESLEAEEAAVEIPVTVSPDPVGPAPLESTLPAGYAEPVSDTD